MASTQTLIELIKAELKAAGLSYADLARELGLSESSIKRMFASGGEMPLSRIDEICRVLHCDFAELSAKLAQPVKERGQLTLEQERAVVADPKLLLVAICCLSQWSFEQIVAAYRITPAELTAALVQLDRLGVIELRPGNRYKLLLTKALRWHPQGPVMQFFREDVVQDYFSGGFDGDGELLMLVHGQIGRPMARELAIRLQRVAEDFASQHMLEQKLPADEKHGYTLVLSQRHWLFERFRYLQR